MKKTLIWIFIALISGAVLGKLTFNKYEKLDTQSVISLNNKVYMLLYGSYNSLDEMYNKVTSVDRYVYILDDGKVSAYVAASTSKKNIEKIKAIYDKKNIDVSVKKVIINNDEFIQNINEYEKLLDATDEENSLLIIENQILSCYEKLAQKDE